MNLDDPVAPGEQICLEEAPLGHLARPHARQVRAGLTERWGGESDGPFGTLNLGRSTADPTARVLANEQRVLRHLGLPDRVARLRLEHGTRILEPAEPGLHGMADALLSDQDDLTLWLTVADCYPVAITLGRWRTLGHCGWRGVAGGLPIQMLAALAAASGCDAALARAWIGPGIGACCYEVGPEVSAAFPLSALRPGTGDRSQLDLRAEIRRQLESAGLPSAAVAASSSCTACEAGRFFSHRRDGVPAGRMAALCWVEPG
ncbi:MAG: laccase domain-containing protein [Candidatus Eisenbacteria bacterium]|nr:laccase domain-containing protein [Candidatus Eisenbacteria bacterium]MCC7141777.1 laccase domain-containing protein [Candidatus Eisenbacteria bacterium]